MVMALLAKTDLFWPFNVCTVYDAVLVAHCYCNCHIGETRSGCHTEVIIYL